MFTQETQAQIKAVAEWMDVTTVPPGTEVGHIKSASRAILGLYRLTGGDMAQVQEKIAEYIAQKWRVAGCEPTPDTGMTPIFTETEISRTMQVV